MKKGFSISFLIAILTTSMTATARDKTDAALQLSNDYATCQAYFTWAEHCIENNEGKDADATRAGLKSAQEAAQKRMYVIGKSIQKTDDALLATMKISLDEMLKEMNGSCVNLSSILVKHTNQCKRLLEASPADLLLEYQSK